MTEVKELKREIIRLVEEVKDMDVGSEEYNNASKSAAQFADAINKLDKIDWMALAKDGTMIILYGMLLIFNLAHIVDLKMGKTFRSFFRHV